ncbi:MAG TPA: PAS domain S-box protein [Pyrinomonadaceae bacterium]|jgi:PAS domain S-box-containing protein|nr:PAS domain S-box protein [Pyrinomonadaceae bacterium]
MLRVERSPLLRYGFVFLVVASALFVSWLLEPIINRTPFALFYAAVMLSAWYGGLRHGLLATALSALLGAYFFLPPARTLDLELRDIISIILFLMVASLISALTASRRRAQEVLRVSEERFRTIIEQSPLSVQVFSTDGVTRQVNRAWEKLWGVKLEQIVGYNILEDEQLVVKGVMPYLKRAFDGQASVLPAILYDPNQTIPDITVNREAGRWVRAFAYPVQNAAGQVSEVVLLHEDITEQRRAAEAIAYQAHLLDTVEQAVIATDLNGTIKSWNRFAETLYGWPADEALGNNILDLLPAMASKERAHEIMRALRQGESWSGEFLVRRRDGETFPAMVTDTPIYDDEGAIIGVVGISVDISESKRAEAERAQLTNQVEAERERLRSIVANVPGVVWEAWGEPDAASQRIDFVSDYVETMLGYNKADWLGTPNFWLTIVHEDDKERAAQEAAAKFNSGKGGSSQFRWVASDGRIVWVEARSVTIRDDEGKPAGMSGVTMDITERKQIEEARAHLLSLEQSARLKAEEANRTKDEFLATLSHELRTPLTAMLGWTRIMRTNRLDESMTAHALEIIERNATLQAQLIEDLLDVSRIIGGNLRLNIGPVELAPVIAAVLDSVRPAADAKNITLEIRQAETASLVSGDPARLQQVFWNLLINSVKFTPQGGRVDVLLARVEGQVEIRVRDTGQGISQEFLPYVFDRFRQADASITRMHGGLGLGLAIVRHLVEAHGGAVRVESEGAGRGATFIVSLPRLEIQAETQRTAVADAMEEQAGAATPLVQDTEALKGLRVLVVDDDSDTRDWLKTVLESNGGDVTSVGSAAQALTELERLRPDLLISDIGMPEEDGYVMIRKVRALAAEHGGLTLAAALTAYAGDEARRQSLNAGFQVHLSKPIDPGELVTAIRNLIASNGQA